jgi:hypothetical protein
MNVRLDEAVVRQRSAPVALPLPRYLPPDRRDTVLWFGKYNGKALSWVVHNDVNYSLWMASKPFVRENTALMDRLCFYLLQALQARQDVYDARQYE